MMPREQCCLDPDFNGEKFYVEGGERFCLPCVGKYEYNIIKDFSANFNCLFT